MEKEAIPGPNGNHRTHDSREASPSEGTAGGFGARGKGRGKGQGPHEGTLHHRKPNAPRGALQARKPWPEAPLGMELPWFRRVRSPWEWVQLPPGLVPLATGRVASASSLP